MRRGALLRAFYWGACEIDHNTFRSFSWGPGGKQWLRQQNPRHEISKKQCPARGPHLVHERRRDKTHKDSSPKHQHMCANACKVGILQINK